MGEYTQRPLALQILIGGGGIALGAYCVKAAYCVGAEADIMIGIALASLVVVSWGMLPWADVRVREGAKVEAQVWRLAWIGVLAVVVANGVSYSAHYRVERTGGAEVKIEAYEDAKRRLATAEGELAELKKNARWETTKGCSNATAEASKGFCAKVGEAKAEIAAQAAIKSSSRPASSDAGVGDHRLGYGLGRAQGEPLDPDQLGAGFGPDRLALPQERAEPAEAPRGARGRAPGAARTGET